MKKFYKVTVRYYLDDDNGKEKKYTEYHLVQAESNEQAGKICKKTQSFPEASNWEILDVVSTSFTSVTRLDDLEDDLV